MAPEQRRLTVSYSSDALAALDQIWVWNAEKYGVDHADRYIAFLRVETDKLASNYLAGRAVPTRPNFQYIVIRRRRRGHGHVAVYEVNGDIVYILEFFHTAQDWQTKLKPE